MAVTQDLPAAARFANINSNATTVVYSGRCILLAIIINKVGASANVADVYDNTAGSGTKVGQIGTTSVTCTLTYNVRLNTGLTVVTATGTAADLTVVYAPLE